MKDAMLSHGLNEPEFVESGEFFKVIFWLNSNSNNLNSRQKMLLRLNIDKISKSRYIELFEVSKNTASSDLNKLVEYGYFDRIKNGRGVIFKRK